VRLLGGVEGAGRGRFITYRPGSVLAGDVMDGADVTAVDDDAGRGVAVEAWRPTV